MLTLVLRTQSNVACWGILERVLHLFCLFELITLITVINLYLNEQSIPLFVQCCHKDVWQASCADEDVSSVHLGNYG